MDVLVVASYFAPASTKKCGETAKRLCSWVESIFDKRGKRNLDDRRKNRDFGQDRDEEGRMVTTKGHVVGGIKPREENSNSREMIKKQRRRASWPLRPHDMTMAAPSLLTTGGPAALTTSWCRRRPWLQNATDCRKFFCSHFEQEKGECAFLSPSRSKCPCGAGPYAEARVRIDKTELMRCVTKGEKKARIL